MFSLTYNSLLLHSKWSGKRPIFHRWLLLPKILTSNSKSRANSSSPETKSGSAAVGDSALCKNNLGKVDDDDDDSSSSFHSAHLPDHKQTEKKNKKNLNKSKKRKKESSVKWGKGRSYAGKDGANVPHVFALSRGATEFTGKKFALCVRNKSSLLLHSFASQRERHLRVKWSQWMEQSSQFQLRNGESYCGMCKLHICSGNRKITRWFNSMTIDWS